MRRSLTGLISLAFVGGLLGRGLRYLLNIIIARSIGLDALGIFAFGLVVLKAAAVVARLGLDNAALKYVPRFLEEEDREGLAGFSVFILLCSFSTGILISSLLYLSRDYLAIFFSDELIQHLPYFLAGIPILSVLFVGLAITRGFGESKYFVAIRDLSQSTLAAIFVGFGGFMLGTFPGIIVGYLLATAISVVLLFIALWNLGVFQPIQKAHVNPTDILSYSLPLLVVASTQYFINWTDVLVLGVFVSSTNLGYYQAAYQTSLLLLVVLQSANVILPSVISSLHGQNEDEQLERVYRAGTRWISAFTALGFVYLAIYARPIMLIFGEPTPMARTALIILAAGQFVTAATGPVGYLLSMTQYERIEPVNTILVLVLNVGLNIVLVRAYGVLGAAIATATTLALLNILRLIEVYFLLNFSLDLSDYSRGLISTSIAAVAMAILDVFLPSTPLELLKVFGGGITGLIVFGLVQYYIGLDDDDRFLLESLD